MCSSNCLFRQKRWFDRSEILTTAGLSLLASSFLLLLIPGIGIVFLEVLAGFVLLTRAFVLRLHQRKATQLRRALPTTVRRIRFPNRYELVLTIVVILSYAAIAAMLRAVRVPDVLIRVVPLLSLTAGLAAKKHVQRAIAGCTNCLRERLGRSETRTGSALRGEAS
jgi:hypothetical protein